jgi:tol-pal system protein YbgF
MVLPGSNHTSTPMARSALHVTALSALSLAIMTASPLALSAACAQEAERPFGLLDRIFSGSERFGGGSERAAPSAGPEQTAQLSGSDLLLRLERLESQIRQLTGVIEQLQFRNQQLEGQLRRMQEEYDSRFQGLGSTGAARPSSPPRPQSQPPSASGAGAGRRGDAFDPAQSPNAPGAPHTLGSVNAPPIGTDVGRDVANTAPAAGPGPAQPRGPAPGGAVATLPPSQTPRDEYDLAYGYVLRKDYALAEDSFRSFLSKYPDDRLAGDATYWLGESQFQRQSYRDAAEAFLNVSTKYESSAKAPDALLRLGQSLALLGEKEAACASLGEVSRKFPRASASVKQGVEREQKRARC